jgi:hypothetical protein
MCRWMVVSSLLPLPGYIWWGTLGAGGEALAMQNEYKLSRRTSYAALEVEQGNRRSVNMST